MNKAISRTAARAVLLEIQRLADIEAKTSVASDNEFARTVLHRLIGTLEAKVPISEWDRTDVFRARTKPNAAPK